MLRTALVYGLALAAGALAPQWLEYRWWAWPHAGAAHVARIAASFLTLGIWAGSRLFPRRPTVDGFSPNERARASLGITDREYDVLRLLAVGCSNKQIARELGPVP